MKVTPAERRALEAWWRHDTTKEAAVSLGRSPRTIEQQLASARARLGVTTSRAAVRMLGIDASYVENTDTQP